MLFLFVIHTYLLTRMMTMVVRPIRTITDTTLPTIGPVRLLSVCGGASATDGVDSGGMFSAYGSDGVDLGGMFSA